MLSLKDNELLTHVGPGTPMGDLMRQYWMPIYLSSDIAENDCKPQRIKLLGEQLLIFRDTQGRAGPPSGAKSRLPLFAISADFRDFHDFMRFPVISRIFLVFCVFGRKRNLLRAGVENPSET